MKVVLAEKPSVARDLARALGAGQRNKGYLEGNGWAVTWALGHLVELKEPHEYQPEWRRWSLESLPILPERFGLRPRGDAGAQEQLKTVVSLFKQAELIVCATDAGREGELIFRYVQQWAKATRVPFKRLWIHSLTEQAIAEGLAHLEEGRKFDPLFQAARCRSEADWIIGMNATRFYSVMYGAGGMLWSAGRVQTPVLALIAQRDGEIEAFKPEPYWELHTLYREVRFKHRKGRFDQEAEGVAMVERLRPHPLKVVDVKRKEEKTPPPQLYDLSSLQQEMNKWYGLTAEQTLAAAQRLYEAKLLTYPRTDSRYLSGDLKPRMPALLESLRTRYPEGVSPLDLETLSITKRVFDDSKVTDHHAIIPTGEPAGTLGDHDHKVYDAVARRLIAVFHPACRKQVTTVDAEVDGEGFRASGKVPVAWGWQILYPHLQKQRPAKDDGEFTEQEMPEMVVGEQGPHAPELVAKMTQAPKRYTEASLLQRMETAGKLVDDEALREAMKQRGLGTPATRAAIIETLLARKYIERRQKALVSTEAGRHLLRIVHDERLKSPELTGDWEAQLKAIENGTEDPETFMAMVREHAARLVRQKPTHKAEEGGLGPCPLCRAPVIEGRKGYGCSRWKEGCAFVLWRESLGLEIDHGLAAELLHTGASLRPHPVVIDGEPRLATLRLTAAGILEADVVAGAGKAPEKNLGTCPLCGGYVVVGKTGYGCSNWKAGCPLRIWKSMAKKNITQTLVKQLIREGRTDEIEGFVSKAGKPFKARLKLEGGKVVFDFG